MGITGLAARGVVLLWLTVAGGAEAMAASPHGIFADVTGDSSIPPAMLTDPDIVGVTITSGWSVVEPHQHVYSWTQMDENVAAAASAGLQVALRVTPGVFAPSWLYAVGAKKMYFRWYLSGSSQPLCSQVAMPVPWDPVTMLAWTTFINAFAAHYANNPAVTMIHLEGITSVTNETLLAYSAGTHNVGEGVCGAAPILPVTQWQAVGYTPNKVSSAWTTIVATYAAGFPTQVLSQEVGSWDFPPIDNTGAVISGSSGDKNEGPALMQIAYDGIGERFMLQNDGLSTHWVFPKPATVPATTPLAFEIMPITGDSRCVDNNLITPCDPATVLSQLFANAQAVDAPYLEMAPIDLENPALAGPIAAYAQ